MLVRRYHINPETLRYERVRMNRSQKLRFALGLGLGLIALAILMRFGFERVYPTPRQVIYNKENRILRSEYKMLNSELQEVESKLAELRNRDDRFYRAILNLDPIPYSIRTAGTGGSPSGGMLKNLRDPAMWK